MKGEWHEQRKMIVGNILQCPKFSGGLKTRNFSVKKVTVTIAVPGYFNFNLNLRRFRCQALYK